MMRPQKSIALLICYFGELPWYFNYYVHSCRYNPTVDFYIVTDNTTSPCELPENVKFVHKTIDEVKDLASDKLGFQVNMDYSYKLCDFKPAYGFIFSDILGKYDFWGHGDIDVIYGNIRDFITDDLMDTHDLFSIQPRWLPGCFLLFRNSHKMNTLFMLSKDYKTVFENNKHYCFDETNFTHHEFNEGMEYQDVPTEIESMTHVVKKRADEGYIKPYFDLHIIEGDPGNIRWDRGNMVYKNKYSAILYHLIDFKKHYSPKRVSTNLPESFNISPTKIYHKPVLKIREPQLQN